MAELENLEEEVKLEKERLEIVRERLKLEQELAAAQGNSSGAYIAALKEQAKQLQMKSQTFFKNLTLQLKILTKQWKA